MHIDGTNLPFLVQAAEDIYDCIANQPSFQVPKLLKTWNEILSSYRPQTPSVHSYISAPADPEKESEVLPMNNTPSANTWEHKEQRQSEAEEFEESTKLHSIEIASSQSKNLLYRLSPKNRKTARTTTHLAPQMAPPK